MAVKRSLIYRGKQEEGGHVHYDKTGIAHRCYHKCRSSWKTWMIAAVLAIAAFPVEHFMWERIPPLNDVAQYLGLEVGHKEEK